MDAHLELCGPCAEYVEQVRTTARLTAVATAELELRPDRDALLTASGSSTSAAKEFRRGSDDPVQMSGTSNKPNRLAHYAALVGAGATAATVAHLAATRKSSAPPAAPSEPRGGMPFATDSAFVGLIESVAAATAKAETIEDAVHACVEHVCRWTGWPVGHAYLSGKCDHDPLQPSNIWYLGHPSKFEPFRAADAGHAAGAAASACRAASPPPAAPPGSSTSPATPTSRAPRPAPRSACAARSPSRSRSATRRSPSSSASRCRPSRPTTACSRSPRTSAASSAARSPASSSATPCASPRTASARSPSPRPTRSWPPTRTATSSPGTAAPS